MNDTLPVIFLVQYPQRRSPSLTPRTRRSFRYPSIETGHLHLRMPLRPFSYKDQLFAIVSSLGQ
jgi:hypothetical protein